MSDSEKDMNEKRILVLETKLELMLDTFTKAIEKLEKKLDQREENYVTKEVFNIELKQRDARLDQLEDSKKENRNLIPTWATVVVSVVALGVTIIALFVH